MTVKIRLKKAGRKKDPHYKVVAVDSRKKRDGRVLDYLGHYHPQDRFPNIVIDLERYEYFIKTGAQVTDTVRTLINKLRRDYVEPEEEKPKKPPVKDTAEDSADKDTPPSGETAEDKNQDEEKEQASAEKSPVDEKPAEEKESVEASAGVNEDIKKPDSEDNQETAESEEKEKIQEKTSEEESSENKEKEEK